MRGAPLGPLHGLPLGVKDLQDTAGLLTTYGNVAPARQRAGARQRARRAAARGRRHRHRQDQRARHGRRRQHAQPGVGRDRQPVRSGAERRRLVGRLGGGAGGRHAAAAPPAPTPAARCAFRPRCAAWSACGPRPAWWPTTRGRSAGRSSRCSGRWAARVADTALQLAASVGFDARDPLSYAGRRARRSGRSPRSTCRRCAWAHRRLRPVHRRPGDPARVPRARRGDPPAGGAAASRSTCELGDADRAFDIAARRELRRRLRRHLPQRARDARAQRARQRRDGRRDHAGRPRLGAPGADAHRAALRAAPSSAST